jgi:mannosyltransferase
MTHRRWLFVLTALALAVRIPGLDGGLWFDEIVTLVLSVREPFLKIVTEYPWNNVHPLFSVLSHASVAALGEHAWTLRLPAVLFGVASVPFVYAVAAEMGLRREGLWASALVAVSYHHVWFSQSARGYTMLAFFALLTTWLLLRARRDDRALIHIAYGIAAGLGAYTHLTMGFIVAAHGLVVAARVARSPHPARLEAWTGPLLAFGTTGAVTLALYAPLLLQAQAFFAAAPASGARVATTSWAIIELLRGLDIGLGAIGVAIAGVLGVVGFFRCLRDDWESALLLTLPGATTLVGTVAMQRPIFPRFFFFLMALAMIFVARGASVAAAWIGRRWPASGPAFGSRLEAGVMLVLVAMSAASLGAAYAPKQDYVGALRYVEGARRPEEPVLTAGLASLPYREYFKPPWRVADGVGAIRDTRAGGLRTWMVYTFPVYLKAMEPEVMDVIQRECPTVRQFPGSVSGGEVVVCVFQPGIR